MGSEAKEEQARHFQKKCWGSSHKIRSKAEASQTFSEKKCWGSSHGIRSPGKVHCCAGAHLIGSEAKQKQARHFQKKCRPSSHGIGGKAEASQTFSEKVLGLIAWDQKQRRSKPDISEKVLGPKSHRIRSKAEASQTFSEKVSALISWDQKQSRSKPDI